MHLSSLFVSFVAAVGAFAQPVSDPFINNPMGVTQCQPVQLTWWGSRPPYTITVVPGEQFDADPLVTLGPTPLHSIIWMVNLPSNEQYNLVISDNGGSYAASIPFTIEPGSADCLAPSQTPAADPVRIRGRAVYL